MRKLFTLGFILLFAGLVNNTIGFVGIIILTIASCWVLTDLAGKI